MIKSNDEGILGSGQTRKLMKLSQYREVYFQKGSQPSINTLKKWINQNSIDGRKIAGQYYAYSEPDIITVETASNEPVGNISHASQQSIGGKEVCQVEDIYSIFEDVTGRKVA
ncbi:MULTISPECIES: hypothetical protein [unclassified Oleiphilus]|uniref:hypothetical protein n=1 Tax=unclassified Oleiphilus TaxID=2631174 RepID=UPI0007C2916C|nr:MULTISPECIES: hypothetical protein [unclassified Oleiphilus]KZY34049.1 hypothetical protein A3729_18495 [Oleiphilus sp. HI0043]KZZ66452.1 hypothetical protein A3763_17330 [Oleiphilus sp. HI0128]KZZ66990.1 hypothetical protein A3763_16680 [Oleiphilus sp. HI0128]